MKAAVLYEAGGPENFVIEDRPVPKPVAEKVLVKVKAFGLNRSELMTRKGYSPNVKFPRILGIECVGEVAADPSAEYKPGQKVAAVMGEMGREYDGSYAEYALLPKNIVCPFESHLDWSQLGAMPEMFHTVSGSLHLALQCKSGETILIRGGTSSIGMLAIQMAKGMGMTVIATTRKEEKRQILLNNGADYVLIDNNKIAENIRQIFTSGVDNVLELVGTTTLPDSLQCAAPGGSVCMTGMLSEQWSIQTFAPMEYIPATVNLTVYDSGQVAFDKTNFQSFINSVEAGHIKLPLNHVFTLNEIVEAHRYMESNTGAGKIVVVID